jgi:hypothetical protein
MKIRKIVGIVTIVVGAVVFSLGLYVRARVKEVKKSISTSSGLLPDNSMTQALNKSLDEKIRAYDSPILWALIGGTVLVIVGVGTLVTRRK